jgi:hypothetical protein
MKKAAGYLIVALNALIVLFFLFRDELSFPPVIQSFGRIHPLFLHIPIGVLLLTVVIVFVARRFASRELVHFLLGFFAVTAALTALMGIVLGAEEGYDADALNAHRISGILVSFISWAAYAFQEALPEKPVISGSLLVASTVALLVAGHLGSVITHGDQFVWAPLSGEDNDGLQVSDSTSMFRAAVFPILETKCLGCHNDNKRKGELSMSTMAQLFEGGEHGTLWHRGEPRKSLLISRVVLPEDHKEHMPPKGKSQLTLLEVNLLYQWIQSGADTTVAWTLYSPQDTVRKLAERMIATSRKDPGPQYDFDSADEETVKSLNDPYRTVTPIAEDEPALAVSFYIRDKYNSTRLEDLLKVKEQVVALNLDGMPVSDDDCETLSGFSNLERLNINFSSITGECLSSLASLEHLRSLAVAGTKLNDSDLAELRNFPALKSVYVWSTAVTDPQKVSDDLAGITVEAGAPGNEREVLRLSAPMLAEDLAIAGDEDSISFTHKLPGTIIRYTTDGSKPDSVSSQVYSKPFTILECTEINAIACKPGWYCSKAARFLVFSKGHSPSDVSLNTQPNKDYRGQGGLTISDNKKGFADNYRGDLAWLGYRENPFDATFSFENAPEINEIVIAYARNTPSFLFPPVSVEVWGGNDKKKLSLLRKVEPLVLTEYGTTQNEALRIPLDHARFTHYKIIARPLPQLPKWHFANKKETNDKRTWVFIDEIFFN